jgi:hypothetical protein
VKADNEFLLAIASKLQEISENTVDLDTQSELDELIEILIDTTLHKSRL